MTKPISLLAIFLLINAVVIGVFYTNTNLQIDHYLQQKTKEMESGFSLIKTLQQPIADDLFLRLRQSVPDLPETLDAAASAEPDMQQRYRKQLTARLLPFQNEITRHLGAQLHLFLTSGVSFLRMFETDRYGQKIKKIRPTAQTCLEGKPAHGIFEVGLCTQGLRYFYPIDKARRVVGCAEFILPSELLVKQLNRVYPGTYGIAVNMRTLRPFLESAQAMQESNDTATFDTIGKAYALLPGFSTVAFFERGIKTPDPEVFDQRHFPGASGHAFYLPSNWLVHTAVAHVVPLDGQNESYLFRVMHHDPFVERLRTQFFRHVAINALVTFGLLAFLHWIWKRMLGYKQRIIAQKERFEKLFMESADGIVLVSESLIKQCNQSFTVMFNAASCAQLEGISLRNLLCSAGYEAIKAFAEQTEAPQKNAKMELQAQKIDGLQFWCEISLTRLEGEGGTFLHIAFRDISRRKVLEDELKLSNKNYLALTEELEERVRQRTDKVEALLHHDQLTQVYSRYRLLNDLQRNRRAIMMVIQVNDFKRFNEIYGIETGNAILISVARQIQPFAKDEDFTLYRTASTKFGLLKETDFLDTETLEEEVNFLEHSNFFVKVHVEDYEETISVDTCIGIAFGHGLELLNMANTALSYAKEHRLPHTFYTLGIDTKRQNQKFIEAARAIKQGLHQEAFVPIFQPIVNAEREIVKYETLMRLQIEENGALQLLAPSYFMQTAYMTHYYPLMSEMVIKKSIAFFTDKAIDFSINLSTQDMQNSAFCDRLYDLIETSGIGHRIIFEIVEDEEMKDYRLFKTFSERFRMLDVRLAIDDFGSGFSNFNYILELAPDYLKIDGSLIKNLDSSAQNIELVRAVIQFAKALGITTIAEFVSTEKIFEIAKKMGIDEFQGYYFGAPKNRLQ